MIFKSKYNEKFGAKFIWNKLCHNINGSYSHHDKKLFDFKTGTRRFKIYYAIFLWCLIVVVLSQWLKFSWNYYITGQ